MIGRNVAPPRRPSKLLRTLEPVRHQIERRNLSGPERTMATTKMVELLDAKMPQGQRNDIAPTGATSNGKSAADTAAITGVSPLTIERTRAVLASTEEETQAQLLASELRCSLLKDVLQSREIQGRLLSQRVGD
jgi:hypothetical protein